MLALRIPYPTGIFHQMLIESEVLLKAVALCLQCGILFGKQSVSQRGVNAPKLPCLEM